MSTLWLTPDRTRRFLVPDDAALPPGDFLIQTAAGRERTVDEAALAPYAVTEEEAKAWAKEQLGDVFGEMRGQALGFVEQLRARTAELREENRATWEKAAADAPEELREAAGRVREVLKELGQTLQRVAREHGAGAPPSDPPRPEQPPAEDEPPP